MKLIFIHQNNNNIELCTFWRLLIIFLEKGSQLSKIGPKKRLKENPKHAPK
jgi:hypothetical protein